MARRTYRPTNRFVVRSKLSESEFVTLLHLYLHGLTAPQARAKFAAMCGPDYRAVPSEKTIAQLFRRIGRYIFHTMVERALAESSPWCAVYNRQGDQEYQEFLDITCEEIVRVANEKCDYEMLRGVLEGKPEECIFRDFYVELRRLIAARKGTKADYRADVGLATMRFDAAENYDRSLTDAQRIEKMTSTILGWMFDEPLDEHGNLDQVFPKEPIKFTHGNYELPDRVHWNKPGFNLKYEIRKRDQKRSADDDNS